MFKSFKFFEFLEIGQIKRRSSSIFEPIQNPLWPLGSHLGFSFPPNISRIFESIDLKCCRIISTIVPQIKLDFLADRKSNMATRQPSWIFILPISREAFELFIWNFAAFLVHMRSKSGSILEQIVHPIWPHSSNFFHLISQGAFTFIFCRLIGTFEMQVNFDLKPIKKYDS